ncbi:MAG TPA: hypothetical protein VGL58_14050 [Caulobacteraceae bacterium]
MPTLMSIGADCQVSHQIRRVTGDETAYLFDWLITPVGSCGALLGDDSDWFGSGNWEITADGMRVRDKGTGLEFQHEFPLIDVPGNLIDVAGVEGHLGEARAKYAHLKAKTLAALRSADDLVLIRREWWTDAWRAAADAAAILETYSPLNPGLRLVLVSEAVTADCIYERYVLLKLEPGEAWTGDDRSWDRVFALIGAWSDARVGA